MSNKRIKESQYPDIWESFNNGRSPESIGADLGVCKTTVLRILSELMAEPSLRKRPKAKIIESVNKIYSPTVGDAIKDPSILDDYR